MVKNLETRGKQNKTWDFKLRVDQYLRPKNDSTSFQEECEVAREIETSSKPLPWWHIKLSATLISKRFEIKYGILEGNGVQCFPIPDCAKLQDRYTVWSGIQCQIICALSTPFLSITFNSIAQYQNHKQWQLRGK